MAITQIRGNQIKDEDLTSDDLADASVRGATGNAGTQREIATGTVSTVDLRDDAVDASKLLETDDYNVGTLSIDTASTTALVINSTDLVVDTTNSRVGIGGATVTDVALAITSTTQAFLPPRMTTTQRDNIGTPIAGMLVYNSTTGSLNVYTSSWGEVGGTSSSFIQVAGDPGGPAEGDIWYDTVTKQYKGRTDTTTVILG